MTWQCEWVSRGKKKYWQWIIETKIKTQKQNGPFQLKTNQKKNPHMKPIYAADIKPQLHVSVDSA